jgi:hypothetical protein
VTYPGFTPVGNATLVVANVLTCNKHSHMVTQRAVLRCVGHRLLPSWTRAPCRSPLLVGSGLVMQLREGAEMRAARQVGSMLVLTWVKHDKDENDLLPA